MCHSISFELGGVPITVQFFELWIGVGLIVAIIGLDVEVRHLPKKTADTLFMIATVSMIVGVMGANRATILLLSSSLWETGKIHSSYSGFSFLPGLLIGGVTFALIAWWYKLPLLSSVNSLIPPLVIAHAFGRIGCFFGGCCFGAPTNCPLAIVFPPTSAASKTFGFPVGVHPTQLYEAVLLFGVWIVTKKIVQREHRTYTYLLAYGTGRFAFEFMRGDQRGVIPAFEFLSPSQLISIGMVVTGASLLLWSKTDATTPPEESA
ncbi:MAG: prolipoprotein diacylglyceryl transferase [Planctomycetaceae bacterium]|nr:prolipoprotein diacylglyceryl transferase [Planctomycetaceae bacterium]MDG2388303.1 prolipoprotein diacylglyceryl transferase [Planctomycetaceae bacterium]